MTPRTFPAFATFFEATHDGTPPFPWQRRLAQQVVEAGWVPEIGIPTGLGKTACIDVAVWSLAHEAAHRGQRSRTLPTRVWYVVNRRLLVDAAYDHGCLLAGLLDEPLALQDRWKGSTAEHVQALQAVADALRGICGVSGEDDPPIVATRLRGAADLGVRPAHPAYPALIFATVPMFASSWLFRGYASSRSMRPVDAAHAGIDALVLLDEAHLARPLQNLTGPVAECDVGDPAMVVPEARARPVLVSLTATGDADQPFTLDDDDLRHPVVQARLGARKPARLRPVAADQRHVASHLSKTLLEVLRQRGPSASVVFANTPVTARAVFDELVRERGRRSSPLADADVVLLTGRMRRWEAERVRERVLDPDAGAPAKRAEGLHRRRHLVVVSTQTLEVGADLDFDVLVTESCGTRALVQRLGRLNRMGSSPDPCGIVVHPEKEKSWPVYGEEPAAVWDRLRDAVGDGEEIDLAPARVAEVLGRPGDQPPRTAELLPHHVWEWAKTSFPPPGEAPIEPFYEGFAEPTATVSLCWRATAWNRDDRLVPNVHSDETVDVPIGEAREALAGLAEGPLHRLGRDRVTIEDASAKRLRPGDVLVLSSRDGLYDEHGWAPGSTTEVADVSLRYWPGLPLDERTLRHWFAPEEPLEDLVRVAKELRAETDDLDLQELAPRAFVAARQLTILDAWSPVLAPMWATMKDRLQARIDLGAAVPMLVAKSDKRTRELQQLASDAFDDLSAGLESVRLPEHLADVGTTARKLAEAAGLAPELVRAVEVAGRFHDAGKADRRFQRWLDPLGEADGLLAKSTTPRWSWTKHREQSGWPQGGRHEALSARLLQRWLELHPDPAWDADLVLHLVVSHHGYGRPLIRPAQDVTATTCSYEGDLLGDGNTVVLDVSGDLAEVDWDQPARFRHCCERYGYWGVALLEAIMRQADHQVSMQAGVA